MTSFHLFERFGVELEYMIVDRDTLAVRPIADVLLRTDAGEISNSIERGPITWSNELVSHVIELKTTDPVPNLNGLAEQFQSEVHVINQLLAPHNACLMPTGMHPFMDPHREMVLWPHENNEIYATFNRIFDCRGHGWANLQSVHINLPFMTEEEFGRLHAAIRLLLPIMPALSASSPIMDARADGFLDHRLDVYRNNCAKIPSVTGKVIPEPVFTFADYQSRILETMYREIAPFDPEGILQDEWLNARGAIARFERNTIEIRVLDVQECPAADLAIVKLIVATVKALTASQFAPASKQRAWEVDPLYRIFIDVIKDGDAAVINNKQYLELWGIAGNSATALEVWRHIFDRVEDALLDQSARAWLQETIFARGPLARRILTSLQSSQHTADIHATYNHLCDNLQRGTAFG